MLPTAHLWAAAHGLGTAVLDGGFFLPPVHRVYVVGLWIHHRPHRGGRSSDLTFVKNKGQPGYVKLDSKTFGVENQFLSRKTYLVVIKPHVKRKLWNATIIFSGGCSEIHMAQDIPRTSCLCSEYPYFFRAH